MSTTPAHVERVLKMPSVKRCLRKGDYPNWIGICPAHADEKESLSLLVHDDGRLGVTCFAGCEPGAVLTALGLTVADLEVPLTLERFASAKGLKVETLRKLGVEALGSGGIVFHYFDRDGKRLPRSRRRYAMGAKGVWDSEHRGESTEGYLYGEQLAARSSDRRLVIVEGESDTATLVENDITAIGLPGASRTKNLSSAAVENVDLVVAVQEPDAGGEAFTKGLKARLKALGFSGELKVVTSPTGKDVNDWYRKARGDFRVAFEQAVADAKPIKVGTAPAITAIAGTGFKRSDLGNAEYFSARYANTVRYDVIKRAWFTFEGNCWKRDVGDKRVELRMQQAMRARQKDALDIDDIEERQREVLWASSSESSQRLAAALRLAESQPAVVLQDGIDVWDSNPLLLGVTNGVVELATGTLRRGVPEDYITRSTAVPYDPSAKCPVWERCIENIFEGDREMIAFFKRSAGYSLSGLMGETVFWICWGTGGNGKTTALETIRDVLGDYGHTLPFEVIKQQRNDQHPTEIAQLVGKRFLAALEFEGRARLNETRIKALTGGDRQRARLLFENSFEYQPVGKLWIATNSRPVIKDSSRGFWRRVLLVPFIVQFGKDASILPALKREQSGILRWLVEGFAEYQREGLRPPKRVEAATEELREYSDQLAAFLAAECVVEPTARVERSALWAAYERWAIENLDEEGRFKRQRFFNEVRERFNETVSRGTRCFRGVRIRTSEDPPKPISEGASNWPEDNPQSSNELQDRGAHGALLTIIDRERYPLIERTENRCTTCTTVKITHSSPADDPKNWILPDAPEATPDAVLAWVGAVPPGAVVALDTETDSLDTTVAQLVGVSLSANGQDGIFLPVETLGVETVLSALSQLDEKPVEWVVWNAAFDLAVLGRAMDGFTLSAPVHDAMLARALSRAGRPGSDGLKATAAERLGIVPVEYEQAVGAGMLAEYAVADAVYTRRLWDLLRADVRPELLATETAVSLIVARATARPWRVDVERAEAEMAAATARADALKAGLLDALGPINLNSPKQLVEALVAAGVPLSERTSSGKSLSTDDDTLQGLSGAHQIVADLLLYRRLAKALTTGQTLLTAAPAARFKIRSLATDTGRMAGGGSGKDGSVELNVQALPKRVPDGFPNLRAWLRPPDGHVVLAVDLAQVEPRIAANLSGDERLIAAFQSGLDPYQTIADALGIDRKTGKMIWLAVAYGAGASGLAKKAGLDEAVVKGLIERLHHEFPTLSAWKRGVEEAALEATYIENQFGRRRYLRASHFVGTVAANTHIQGTAADVFKLGIVEVERVAAPDARLALFIHDECVLFCREDAVERVAPAIVKAMISVSPEAWPVALAAEAAVGPNLGDLKEWEE